MKDNFKNRDRGHSVLQARCIESLILNGYRPVSLTYHDVLNENDKVLIGNRQTATSMYARSTADVLAIGTIDEFFCEFKTTYKESGSVAISIYALALHCVLESLFDVRCLYVIGRDGKPDVGFWATGDFVRSMHGWVTVPEGNPLNFDIRDIVSRVFRDKEFREKKTGGSNHPYVLLHRTKIETLPDWKTLAYKDGYL